MRPGVNWLATGDAALTLPEARSIGVVAVKSGESTLPPFPHQLRGVGLAFLKTPSTISHQRLVVDTGSPLLRRAELCHFKRDWSNSA